MTETIEPIRVTFLGPTAVGKTSVLAAMSKIIEKQVNSAGVKLTFNAETWPRLNRAILDLEERCYRPNMYRKHTNASVKYSIGVTPTVLDGWVKGAFVPIEIIDYPGEWLDDAEKVEEVKKTIFNASVIMVAIDTIGMMLSEDPECAFTNRTNDVEQVTNVLRETIGSGNYQGPKLIIFVPIRCEKWIRKEQEKEIIDRVKEIYADAFNLFTSAEHQDRVALVIAPVETLGIIEYKTIGPQRPSLELEHDKTTGQEIIPSGMFSPGNFEFYFHRVTDTKVAEPKYADHLLRYAMYFTMMLARERSNQEITQGANDLADSFMDIFKDGEEDSLWNILVDYVGKPIARIPAGVVGDMVKVVINWPTNESLRRFANGRLERLPFRIVQRTKWLGPVSQ